MYERVPLDERFTVDYDFTPDELNAMTTLRLVSQKPKRYTFTWSNLHHENEGRYSAMIKSNLQDPRVLDTWFRAAGALLHDTRCFPDRAGEYRVVFTPGRNDLSQPDLG